MSADEDERSPFTRPGFIASALVVALVVVLGIVIAIVNATRNDDPGATATAGSSTSSAAATTATAAAESASVCGLAGEVLTGTLTTAPEATWEYQGTVGYPTSTAYGPAASTTEGVRYCFQHSPAGALFAAANALVQPTDPTKATIWLDQFLAQGPHRAEILASATSSGTTTNDVRLTIAGFRLLSYASDTALVDIAVDASSKGKGVVGSYVYALVWQDGDWKLSADTASPFSYATIPDLAGYVSWKG